MAGFENSEEGMNDSVLKPGILRSLLVDQIPDPLPDDVHVDVPKIVSAVRTLGLLAESVPEEANLRLAQEWAASVDAWVRRLLSLASSPAAKKRWIGVVLLGLTCQECSTGRFLASFPVWLDTFLSHIQPPSQFISVKIASCASIAHMLSRLSKYPNVKKDGILHAERLVEPVLELLNEDTSNSVLAGGIDLLCTIITFFPTAMHPYYESVEAVIVSKIMSARCSSYLLKEYAHCLATLPKSRGDEHSWSSMMQDLLTSININLSNALKGLETGEACFLEARRSKQVLLTIISTLMLCCCTMITNPYPVQVDVPVNELLALVQRVLQANNFFLKASPQSLTFAQQEFACTELPILQSSSLDLLTAIIKRAHSQLVPYASFIIRLLKGHFGSCTLPMLRIKVYLLIKTLLLSMGIGIAMYIAEDVVRNALADLEFSGYKSNREECYADTSRVQPGNRKRKYVDTIESLVEREEGETSEQEAPATKSSTSISLKIAALEVIESLLTVAGALKSEDLRLKVDRLLIDAATNSYNGGRTNDEQSDSVPPGEPTWADFQFATFRALLASLLSQARVDSHHLSQGLELFRKGKQETGTKISEFCALALLALDVLMHPRVISLGGIPSSSQGTLNQKFRNGLSENLHSGYFREESEDPTSPALRIDNVSPDDDMCNSWLGSGNEDEALQANHIEDFANAEEHMEMNMQAIDGLQEEHPPIDCLLGEDVLGEIRNEPTVKGGLKSEEDKEVIITDMRENVGTSSSADAKVFEDACAGNEMRFGRFILESCEADLPRHDTKLKKHVASIPVDGNNATDDTSKAVQVPGFVEGPRNGLRKGSSVGSCADAV